MSGLRADFEHDAGQTHVLTWTIVDGAGATQNLTGFTGAFLLTRDPAGTTLISKTPTYNTPRTDGKIIVTLADTDTNGYAGGYYYELWLIDATSQSAKAAWGFIYIRPSTFQAV